MRIGILQPGYLPWLGFFEQLYKSDVFVIYDDVQYDKNGWRNRNRIKTPQGIQWLTVPVLTKGQQKPLLRELKINNVLNWRRKHLTAIKTNYSKAIYFKKYIDLFEEVYSMEWESLVELDMKLIKMICKVLKLEREIVFSSNLKIQGDRIERLIKICKKFGADTFYEGAAGRNYINDKIFLKNGITVEYQDYVHPVYNQLYGQFQPYLSIIDLLFNEGEKSLQILTRE